MPTKPAVAALTNLLSSVAIVVLNKLIFQTHRYSAPTTLTAVHFAVTSLGLRLLHAFGLVRVQSVNPLQLLRVSVLYAISIPLSNWSLLYNSVGFYQLSKIAIAPMVAVAESLVFSRAPSATAVIGIILTCVGIACTTVVEFRSNVFGTFLALAASSCTVAYQILTKQTTLESGVSGLDLVYHALPASTVILLVFALFTDGPHVALQALEYPLFPWVLGSAAVSLLTNWSMFALLGALQPLTYNVLGHAKTLAVLIVAVVFFTEPISPQKISGAAVAVVGMAIFSSAT
eukprot:ANDGO_04629.mRNA.1 putative membrane protein At1g06890